MTETLAGNDVARDVRNSQSTNTGGTGLSLGGGSELDTDVGQFAKVGGTVGVDIQQIQGVGVEMVASLFRDRRGAVPGLHEGEVVDGHVRQTLGVLVVDRDLSQSVRGGRRVEGDTSRGGDGGCGRVVSPFSLVGGVLESKEQSLDRVRKVDVNAGGVAGAVDRLRVVGLDLFDEQVAGSLAHEFTLVVGDKGVFGPDLDVGQSNVGVAQVRGRGVGGDTTRANTANDGGDVVDNQEFSPVAEVEAQLHFVVGQSSRGEGNTGVAGVAVGEREHQRGRGDDQTVVGGANSVGVVVQQGDVTNHVLVTNTLGGGDGEGGPEVKEVVIETHLDQIVKGNGGFLQQMVHQITSPTNTGVGTEPSRLLVNGHRGEGDTEPVEQEVVTSTGDVGVPLNVELGGLVQRQGRGDNREPGGLGDTTDKVRDGLGAAIHVLLGLVVRSQIDETGRESIG